MMWRVVCSVLAIQSVLVITEVMPRPGDSEGEWIEILCTGSAPVDLQTVLFGDGTGKRTALAPSGELAPGRRMVLAQRPDSLRARFNLGPSVRVLRPGSWPVLNDRDGAHGYADVIVLRTADGVLDSVVYREAWLPAPGVSLERAGPHLPSLDPGSWGWSLGAGGGTPGGENSLAAVSAPSLRAVFEAPASVEPSSRPARFAYALPGPGRLSFWLVDQEGRRQEIKSPEQSPAQGVFVWSAVPVPRMTGPCFVCLYWSDGLDVLRRCRPVWVR